MYLRASDITIYDALAISTEQRKKPSREGTLTNPELLLTFEKGEQTLATLHIQHMLCAVDCSTHLINIIEKSLIQTTDLSKFKGRQADFRNSALKGRNNEVTMHKFVVSRILCHV